MDKDREGTIVVIAVAVIAVILICGLAVAVLGFLSIFGVHSTTTSASSVTALPPTLPAVAEIVVETLPATPTLASLPVENSLYLDAISGRRAVFVTNTELQQYAVDSAVETSPHIGLLTYADGSRQRPFDFRELEHPQLVFSAPHEVLTLDFTFDDTQSSLYVLIIHPQSDVEGVGYMSRVYRINLDDLANRELWGCEAGTEQYEGYWGAGEIVVVQDPFIVLKLIECYACDSLAPGALLLLNTETGSEKYLDLADDVQFDLVAGMVSYRNLSPFQEPCEPSPGCGADGYRTVYRPAGEIITEELP